MQPPDNLRRPGFSKFGNGTPTRAFFTLITSAQVNTGHLFYDLSESIFCGLFLNLHSHFNSLSRLFTGRYSQLFHFSRNRSIRFFTQSSDFNRSYLTVYIHRFEQLAVYRQ
jgi:hypothetical protein